MVCKGGGRKEGRRMRACYREDGKIRVLGQSSKISHMKSVDTMQLIRGRAVADGVIILSLDIHTEREPSRHKGRTGCIGGQRCCY